MNATGIHLQRRGMLLALSAPSGCGKSVVLRGLLGVEPGLSYSISVTSRAPRGSEADGVDYHFVTRERFQVLIDQGAFYEWAEVHGNLYGTRVATVEDAQEKGLDVAMDIDVQGGLAIKRRSPEAVLVFLLPPSLEVLEQRLRGRASDAEDQVRLRLANAKAEMRYWRDYDYVLVNERIEASVEAVRQILLAERRRAARLAILGLPEA